MDLINTPFFLNQMHHKIQDIKTVGYNETQHPKVKDGLIFLSRDLTLTSERE